MYIFLFPETKPAKKKGRGDEGSDDDADLEQNLNRLAVEGEEARTVDEAISVLG